MKRFITYVVIILIVFSGFPSAVSAAGKGKKANKVDWNPVIEAINQVESGRQRYAKHGNSVGVMQITPILVAECNQILKRKKSKKRYKLSDRFSIAKSKEMFLLIQSVHNPTNNIEHAIRSWNGGTQYSVKKTQRYFEKVMRAMK